MPRAKIELPDHFLFSTELPVRITDINYGGHVGNDTLLALIQEARLQFLNHHGFSEKNVAGSGIIMADAVIIYKSQAFYGDILVISVAVEDFSKHACDFLYRLVNQATGKEVARAKTRVAFFDYQAQTVTDVPPQFRALFQAGKNPDTI